jgi:ribosomal-protein-alanine N-acetyltransferase
MLRSLFKSDLPQILAIEQSVHVAPWTEETFHVVFRTGYAGWVMELDKKIIGFVIVSWSASECHVLNLCVAHAYQHQGYGRQLMDKALEEARKQGIRIAYLEVRRTNSRAISLYEKMQFQVVGERKGYYPTVNGQEDALVFARDLGNN